MKNNADNNGKQRKPTKVPGGITGKGFHPGQSGNPQGRPRTRGLVNALKSAVEQELPDGRTVEEALADTLIEEGLNVKNRLAAISAIYDRIEVKPSQSLDLNDTRRQERDELAKMTDAELAKALREELAAIEKYHPDRAEESADAP